MKMTTTSKILHIDIETFCELDLTKTGVYAYASHPSFEILLFAYAWGNGPVKCTDMINGEFPYELLEALENPDVIKVAHNANFEMTCISEYFMIDVDPKQWQCTMAMAMHAGLPGSLNNLGAALKLNEQKMSVGTTLINYFSKPCKPTKANGQRTRNLPRHDTDKWDTFIEYCIRDVEVEQNVYQLLDSFKMPEWEREVYLLDQEINRRGILIDRQFVDNAVEMDSSITESYVEELRSITGLTNPNSTAQFKQYLAKAGIECKSFTKKTGPELLESVEDTTIKRAVQLKLLLGKTSTAKYEAMIRADNGDHRIKGLFQYYGANRTGRWAGRLVQLQNLPQNHLEELDMVRELVKDNDLDTLNLLYESVPDTLSQLIRTAFIAKDGCKFIVADYSAIEARVIAWLANEKWRQDVFKNNGDIYCASASAMFKVPVVKHGVNGYLRQKGKIAELALGYGGGPVALKSMGALEMGIEEDELPKLVKMWRNSNKRITALWKKVGNEAIDAIYQQSIRRGVDRVLFGFQHGNLIIKLPSGRKLCYQDAKITDTEKGPKISYKGMNQVSRKWELTDTWGGKLVENIVQAIARDCLAQAMLRLRNAGYEIVAHVHDEVIIEAPIDASLEDVCRIMGEPLDWAPGLILNAEGYVTPYYRKD
jgi:DNA polymerase